jgi:hypothetical protein
MKKLFIALLIGLIIATVGVYIRLHAEIFSTHTRLQWHLDTTGKPINTIQYQDKDETAALADISMAILYGGTLLTVFSVVGLLIYPPRKTKYDTKEV